MELDNKSESVLQSNRSRLRVGALVSGSGTNLQAIMDACEQGRVDAEVVVAGSDKPEATGLEKARYRGIPTFAVDYSDIIRRYRSSPAKTDLPSDFDSATVQNKQHLFSRDADPETVTAFLSTRALAEHQLLAQLKPYDVDLLVLAGFMRTLTPYFIDLFNVDANRPRIMNIHPALLPAFPGVDGYGDSFRFGCKVAGCTVHFIDYGEDTGPIIAQKCFAIQEDDTLETVRQKGLALEWQLYPECIQLFARGRLRLVTLTHTLKNGNIVQRRVVKIVQD